LDSENKPKEFKETQYMPANQDSKVLQGYNVINVSSANKNFKILLQRTIELKKEQEQVKIHFPKTIFK
jgi:hypothetical protein